MWRPSRGTTRRTGGVPRRFGNGRDPAHAQPAALPRAGRLHRQSRRGQRHPRRRIADPSPRADRVAAPDGEDLHRHRRWRHRCAAGCASLRGARRRGGAGLHVARRRRALGRRHVLHERHHGRSQGRRLLPPLDLPARDGRVRGVLTRPRRVGSRASDRSDVSRERVGYPVRLLDGGRRPAFAGPVPAARAHNAFHPRGESDGRRRSADDLERHPQVRRRQRGRLLHRASRHLRRQRRPTRPDGETRARSRRDGDPGLGDDGDQPGRRVRVSAATGDRGGEARLACPGRPARAGGRAARRGRGRWDRRAARRLPPRGARCS